MILQVQRSKTPMWHSGDSSSFPLSLKPCILWSNCTNKTCQDWEELTSTDIADAFKQMQQQFGVLSAFGVPKSGHGNYSGAPPPQFHVFFPKKYGIIQGQSLVNNPLTRPYFLGGFAYRGVGIPVVPKIDWYPKSVAFNKNFHQIG